MMESHKNVAAERLVVLHAMNGMKHKGMAAQVAYKSFFPLL
jgi:hypothetical protein